MIIRIPVERVIRMGWLSLLEVSSMPILQIVFTVFTPSLIFASLAETVRLEDIISWWFMPVNIGLTFVVGGTLGWAAVKILRPEPYLQDLIIAMCSTGNFANILLIIIPAICKDDGNPFGDRNACSSVGLSYVSFSMARISEGKHSAAVWNRIRGIFHQIFEELKAPPVLAAIIGFMFGTVTWLRNLVIGDNAPLRVIDDSIKLLGDGTTPCITLILGGNLAQGLSRGRLRPTMIIAVICVRYIILPAVGIGVVQAAIHLGFLPSDPLYHFVLMIHFTLPPSMNIGTMTQLFDVAQEECAVLFLWTYSAAALALTGWSTIFMWILS